MQCCLLTVSHHSQGRTLPPSLCPSDWWSHLTPRYIIATSGISPDCDCLGCQDHVLLPVHHRGLQVLPAEPQQAAEVVLCAPPCAGCGGEDQLEAEQVQLGPSGGHLEILGFTIQEQLPWLLKTIFALSGRNMKSLSFKSNWFVQSQSDVSVPQH